jgi:glutamate-1-semialdehyde 2,1-aminomutase
MPKVLNTRPTEQAEVLAQLLSDAGFDSVHIPLVELRTVPAGLEEVAKLDPREFSGIFLSSPIGLKAMDSACDPADFSTWMTKPFYLVGKQSGSLVASKGGKVAFFPQTASLAGFIQEFPAWWKNQADALARSSRLEAQALAKSLVKQGVGALPADGLAGDDGDSQEAPPPQLLGQEPDAEELQVRKVRVLEGFAQNLDSGVQKWLHPCSEKTRLQPERFAAMNVEVHNVSIYRPQLPEASIDAIQQLQDDLDVLTFCSGSAVDHFFEAMPDKARKIAASVPAASLGAATSDALARWGWKTIVQAQSADAPGLVAAVQKALGKGASQPGSTRFARARQVIPGGVNSPVRAFKSVGGDPIFMASAKGPFLYDADGKEWIDFVLSWGPMILGHAHPEVIEAVRDAASRGLSFGACTEGETVMAETLVKLLPSIEKVRLTCSGTEATMAAIRLARGYTGRDKIVKFRGCYHGHGDSFLVQAGSGAMTFGHPSSPGVTSGAAADTLIADFNDLDSVQKLFSQHPDQIAAIIVEPIVGNMGVLIPEPGFLAGLRAMCDGKKSLLILDEVMTGFRVGLQGAQGRYGIRPDLTTLGKVVGGGMPLAAYGGRKDIMDHLSPEGPVYQAGTLSGNPIAVAAGLATLKLVSEQGFYDRLEGLATRWEADLRQALSACPVPTVINRVGAMMTVFFSNQPVRDYASAAACDTAAFGKFFQACLGEGLYLAPSQFEAGFLSVAHDEEILARVAEKTERAVRQLR